MSKSFYAGNVDYSNSIFSGKLRVVGVLQNQFGFRYKLRCDLCGCTGQTISLKDLVKTEIDTIKCANSGCGKTAVIPDQPTQARCEVRMSDDARYRSRSARAQMEDRQRAEEIAAIEKGGQ